MNKAIEISVIGEASITRNKVLVDYSELKKLTESNESLLEALKALESPHQTIHGAYVVSDDDINKAREAIKAAAE